MFRTHLARTLAIGAALFLVGCNSSSGSRQGGLFSSCSSCRGDRPSMFSRFRTNSPTGQPVIMSSGGGCCDQGMTGPYLPPPQAGTILPAPQMQPPQPNNIPRIDENGKQMPWDPKMNGRPGIKTATDIRTTTKEGT